MNNIIIIKLRCSIGPKHRIYTKNMVTQLSSKYDQKLLDSAKNSTTDAIKTASKRAIHKTAETTGNC